MGRLLALSLALLLLAAPLARAQGLASLVADSIEVSPGGQLTASGNVEVFYDGSRLSARQITYDRSTDRLTLLGPILIERPDGTIFTAERADIDPRLENGLLRGARLVLEEQVQLSAARLDRIDGRLNVLTRTAATSCQVCGNRPPLWEIRARQVVHDEAAQQLYFDSATFHIRGVPVFWLPRLRLPDPTLDRATGFLVPSLRTTDLLGLGIKTPYFIRLGDSRDLTLTPYVSPQTNTLELRYRQAFLRGQLIVDGAVTRDDLRPGETRGYLNARGAWDLGPGTLLSFDLEHSSDDGYLRDYGHSERDLLDSQLAYYRVTERTLLTADLTHYRTLLPDEVQGALPPLVASFSYERRRPFGGGTLTFGTDGDALVRTEAGTGDAARDVARLGGHVAWERGWVLPGGFLLDAEAGLELGYYRIDDDPTFARDVLRTTPSARATLRWPLVRHGSGGATHVLEPVLTLAWSETEGEVPNEDSTIVEFDEGNLTDLTRFAGHDAREQGGRAAIGLSWTRYGPEGSEAGLTFGRIFRERPDTGFTVSSGLAGSVSDWLLAGHIRLPGGLHASARTIFDEGFDFDKTEARLDWQGEDITLSTTYVWLPEEPIENRDAPISEWSLAAAYDINDAWTVRAEGRYDIVAEAPVFAGLGVGWRNECVEVDLSVERRYTRSAEVEPVTDFGLSVNLTGFSTGQGGTAPQRHCRN